MHAPQLIVQPDHGIEPVVALMRSAGRELLLKQFTFDHPVLLDEVLARYSRGVAVRVLLNGAKATGERINDGTFTRLEAAGVPVRWTPQHFLVTHEKSMVVDGARAMVATFNFMEKYFTKTRDYAVVLSDAARVEGIRNCFEVDWEGATSEPDGEAGLSWSPGGARAVLCDLLDSAERSIDIAHPKFAEPVIFERIFAALGRGVRVRLLCGGKHGLHQPDMMYSFALWRLFREAGGRLHKQRGLRSHGKIVIVDEERVYLGTQNLDQAAFDLRRELGVTVTDISVVGAICAVYEADWAESRRYEPPYPIEAPDAAENAEFEADADLRHG
ncbi:phospholipase D-like domain-containing protein [Methylobacterium sp. NEAU 140]|uniref:phospholipase D-like domain-containing protein n=1 Tax=Methylobacterium sp. NEAU 140 TaxID=3064945 RepID=UPI00273582B4|nr:phospholipase D-like domain-containing protein [Methylobacterium sp. NEAU 140]MDP4021663.1 phospholipase D-like domain-containing protein [Methylobacterium sp. NEAU 140]